MSRDIIILVPTGRRIKIHCTPDTSVLQVLEDVCAKQGIQPSDYDLKHHNHVLDLTTTIRFCNIPNKAILEMVEADKKRIESNVTVGLMLDDGERRTADFSPNTSLYDLIITLAPVELPVLGNPTISYMRQEVTGILALKARTLRHLGLITGRAILRLFDKTYIEQPNVSAIYGKVKSSIAMETTEPENNVNNTGQNVVTNNTQSSGPSGFLKDKDKQDIFDPVKLFNQEKERNIKNETTPGDASYKKHDLTENLLEESNSEVVKQTLPQPRKPVTQQDLERRLRIEEEVSFLGSQKAIAFMQPDEAEDELADLPDDFYELSIEEVRKMYHDLQQQCVEMEVAPLITSTKREEMNRQASENLLDTYKNVDDRVQFPDNMILQGVFSPGDTVGDIDNFVKQHLDSPHHAFHIFSTPLKEMLNPKTTLLEARFVPCVHMHFKWSVGDTGPPYLKQEIYLKKTSSDAAGILASKYRAPSRRKMEDSLVNSERAGTSKSKQSKVPRWFRN